LSDRRPIRATLAACWAPAASGAATRPPAIFPMNARRSTRTPTWPLI